MTNRRIWPHGRAARQSGFSLPEILVALVLAGIIGGVCMRMLMFQSRFFDATMGRRSARGVARTAQNLIMSELRMVEDSSSVAGSIRAVSASGKLIKIRVPYWFGLVCTVGASSTTAMMLPIDSAVLASAKYNGYAWRASTGRYGFITPANPLGSDSLLPNPGSTACGAAGAQIKSLTVKGRVGTIIDLKPQAAAATAGSPIFAYQEVTYAFSNSGIYPGRIGLFRQATGGTNDEVMAPFDTSARFRFYVKGADTSRISAPALVDSIVGLDLVLNGASVRTAVGNSAPTMTKMVTSVFFKNRASP
jgi:prepilin-type N-terminal cleavage/methylation domain-containing protein